MLQYEQITSSESRSVAPDIRRSIRIEWRAQIIIAYFSKNLGQNGSGTMLNATAV